VSPRERGRPLAASSAQQAEVFKRHKASLREIAAATSLSLRTVRTIVEKAKGGENWQAHERCAQKGFQPTAGRAYRARKATRDRLPREIEKLQKTGAALVKGEKGLQGPKNRHRALG
jgi:hypothetical protein